VGRGSKEIATAAFILVVAVGLIAWSGTVSVQAAGVTSPVEDDDPLTQIEFNAFPIFGL
jgi:hypothetical protein